MNSRERVLAALNLQQPDKVPFMDWVDPKIKTKIMGKENFDEVEFANKIGLDAIYLDIPSPVFAGSKDKIFEFAGADGYIKTDQDLDLMVFPDPHDEQFYENAKRFIEKYSKTDIALFAGLHPFSMFNTIFSMGFETFCYALYENLPLVKKIMERYDEWNSVVLEKLQSIGGIDFIFASNDMAYKSGPMISPNSFREVFLPSMKTMADKIKIPWVFHSDGDLTAVFDELLSLGMNGIQSIEPSCMDIKEVKEKYGHRVCLWGNIDLHYTLTRGTPEEVEAEVKECMKVAGKNGGHIIGSANAITEYCKVENVMAMVDTINKYRDYPLNIE